MDKEILIAWLEQQKKETYDPNNEGFILEKAFEEGVLDEGDQTRIQTYDEVIDYVKSND